MIYLDVVQGEAAWLEARRGIPTASVFGEIFSPYTQKPVSGTKLMLKLLVEWCLGISQEPTSQFMQRGSAQEQDAIGFYALERDCDPVRPGIFLRDDRLVGASPDLMVQPNGPLAELKVPAASTHLSYLLDQEPKQYKCQQQGQLWIAERDLSDFCSYHPTLPPLLLRFQRDDAFIRGLADAVNAFVSRMLENRERLLKLGVVPVGPGIVVPEEQKQDTTAALTDVLA